MFPFFKIRSPEMSLFFFSYHYLPSILWPSYFRYRIKIQELKDKGKLVDLGQGFRGSGVGKLILRRLYGRVFVLDFKIQRRINTKCQREMLPNAPKAKSSFLWILNLSSI
jgi:hypothetical protein